MNKREKEVIQLQLEAEEDILAELEKQYKRALKDIEDKIKFLQTDELTQSRIYQIQYQQALKGQIEGIIEKLHSDGYTSLQQFLNNAYTDAFVATAYDLAGQGIPLIMPIDQNAAVKAIITDSKIKEDLYTSLGVDAKALKKSIRQEITRGIASGMHYQDIARNISEVSKAPLSRAKTIARTESHRIQQASTYDAQKAAKSKGADVVKMWDSTLDGRTRSTHRHLDGQIKEVEEPFEMDGKKAMFPGEFGDPAEDCNCRCVSLTRARWALDDDELKTLQNRAEFFGLDKTENFEEFKKSYLKAAKSLETTGESDIIVSAVYPEYSRIIRDVDAVEDAKKTNPNFSSQTYEYTNNCQRCVPAWELRQRGFDVIAQPCKPLGEHDALKTSPFSLWDFNPFDKDTSKRVQVDRTGNGKEKIIEFLKESGNGARVEIVVAWEYNPTEGHAFVAKNVDGEILFIDPQNGKSGKYVEDYFDRVAAGETRWLRIDKLPLSERYRKEVIANPYEKST